MSSGRRGPHAVGLVGVGVDPIGRCLLHALPVLVFWLVVVRAGRGLCLIAQRLPPVVLAVRAARSRGSARRVAREGARFVTELTQPITGDRPR